MNEPFGTSIFCDDVRGEAFGKVSLMGVYGYELVLFGKFPTALPKFGVFSSIRFHRSERIDGLKIQIYFPGDLDTPTHTEQIDFKMEPGDFPLPDPKDYPDPSEFRGLNFPVLFAPAVIKQPGYIRVRAIAGSHLIKVGSLRVREATPQETPQTAITQAS